MLAFILTTIVFCLTRQIIRSDSKVPMSAQTRYLSRDTFNETPYLDPAKVLAIDLAKLLP